MKLLILGNHTCGNRGDSAILRGLLDAINTLKPETEVDVMSRYPVSSSWLLNRPVMGDPLYSQMKQHNNAAGVMGRVKKVLRRRYQHQVLLSRVTDTGKLRNIAIAQGFTDFVRLLSRTFIENHKMLREAIPAFAKQIRDFDLADAVLTAVETRTSSPVCLRRNPDDLQSVNVRGFYPTGEGAGYAGGILSSAVDGITVAEAVAQNLIEPRPAIPQSANTP